MEKVRNYFSGTCASYGEKNGLPSQTDLGSDLNCTRQWLQVLKEDGVMLCWFIIQTK